MRTMYDSVTSARIPANAKMVAGYVDGRYANIGNMQHNFPHATVVRIAVSSSTNDGHVLDVEPGDATPVEAVAWVQMRRRSGADPSVYCDTSRWPQVRKAFKDAGIPEPHYWIAQWDGFTTIPTGAIAKQYQNYADYDMSVVADVWPGVDSNANPRPIPTSSYYVVKAGDTLSEIAFTYHLTLRQILDLNTWIHNPDVIRIGDRILISGKGTSPHINSTYKVVQGDNLSTIALKHGLTLGALLLLNPQISNPNLIHPGQIIYL